MKPKHAVIVGGGLAGLSAGCHAAANGFRTTIVEHNLALGGVCTAWHRGPYPIDGCIHWLTGGAFHRLYEELEIVPAVQLRTLDEWVTWRDVQDGAEVSVTRNLTALVKALLTLAPEDAEEIERIAEGARRVAEMAPDFDHPRELSTLSDQLHGMWDMRTRSAHSSTFDSRLKPGPASTSTTSVFVVSFATGSPEAPTLFLLMVLGYLERGFLSRPVGGTAAFRDALVGRTSAAVAR